MFEIFLTVLAIAAHTGGGGGAQTASQAATAEQAPVQTETAQLGVSQEQAQDQSQTGSADASGRPALVAEPQDPTGKFTTATEVKPILGATKSSWVGVREFDGQDLLYVTQILTWRCGLLDLRIGINGAPPQSWDMPACHLDQPMPGVMLEGDGLPYRAFELGSVETVEVELVYDDLTSDRALFGRKDVLMP